VKIPKDLRWQQTGKTLGQGGQAQVQEVVDSLGEFTGMFALKGLAKDKPLQAYERFYREISAIKSLQHRYIIIVVDSSSPQDDFHYYVMEFIEGAIPLQKVLNTTKNPYHANPIAALDLFRMLVEAILACEINNPKVVHRDISPSNVLLVPDGTIKVIDFGICQVEETGTITLTDEGVGTVNYMAPECESGATGNIEIHSDLYSAGKILWSAVTGQRAFSREKPAFTNKAMSKVFPDYPDIWHLHHIFAKTIRNNPSDRWQSAKDAIKMCNHIRRLITNGYPPIEDIFERCPICGVGSLEKFEGSHMVFGNPNPSGIFAKRCSYCGVCMAIDLEILRNNLDKMKLME